MDYMGHNLARYKPEPFNVNRIVNDLFGAAPRYAFMQAAIIVQQKRFPDISFYQKMIDWDLMRTKTDAAIIRCGQNVWEDPWFKRNWSEAKRVGIKRGTYFFYDDRIDPGRQADLVVSLLKDDLPEMEIWCDWENSYGGKFGSLKNVVAFMQAIEAKLLSATVGLYTGYYWFRDRSNLVTNAAQYTYLKQRLLWLAWYTTNASLVLIPAPWSSCLLWQYGTPAIGAEYGVQTIEIDMNFFNGIQADFDKRYGGATDPAEPPTPGEPMNTFYKATGNITIRTGPALSYPIVSGPNQYVLTNDILEASEVVSGFAHIVKLYRNDTPVELPADAYCGTAYLTQTTYTPPAPPATFPDLPVTIVLGDDVTYAKQTVNVTLKPK